jgi:hypothetical protein
VLQARWFRSPYSGPARHKVVRGDPREFEVARAYCGEGSDGVTLRRCGGSVGFYFIEDPGWLGEDSERRAQCFRIPAGFVHRDGQTPHGFWEKSRRAAQHRPIRHNVSESDMDRATMRIPGALRLLQDGRRWVRESFTYVVDPVATGGFVAIRCPNCEWLNAVPPVPDIAELDFRLRA